MARLGDIRNNQQNTYKLVTEDGNNEVAQRVSVTGAVGTGGMLSGILYDYVAVTYPDVDEEVYTFKSGGSGGTTVATITVLYTDSTKANLLSATKV